MDKIIKSVRKELKIPDNLDKGLYELASNKYKYPVQNTVFITQDSNGVIIELSKKPGPFVVGQLLYMRHYKVSPKPSSPKKSEPKKTVDSKEVKKSKQLKPCPPGKIRNPVTGRCVSEIKKSKK